MPTTQTLKEAREAISSLDTKKEGLVALVPDTEAASKLPAHLRQIISSSAVVEQRKAFLDADKAAVDEQKWMMRGITAAHSCLMLAGVLSGIALAISAAPEQAAWKVNVALGLGAAILLLGALAAFLVYWVRESDRLGQWLTMRSRAEMVKLATFKEVATQSKDRGPDAAIFGLAVVVELLLQNQRDWLHERAKKHRNSSGVTALWGGSANALAFVGGSGAVIAGAASNQAWLSIFGVIGAAIGAYAANREALRRDRTNATAYEKGKDALDGLAARLDAVEREIQGGEAGALVVYVDAIIEQMASVHKQWLDGATQTQTLLAELDNQLANLQKRREEKSGINTGTPIASEKK